MHKIESYATTLGLKIDKPHILENYYPMGEFEYITLNLGDETNEAKYKHWQEVLKIISPTLESKGIKVLQLNSELNNKPDKCITLNEKISLNRLAYMIKNSSLHLTEGGVDMELASVYDKNIIYLNCKSSENVDYPFWNKQSDFVCLNETEKVKNINKIKPERIAKFIFDNLNIKQKIEFETIFIGENYQNKSIQFIPDQNTDIAVPEGQALVVRMDKFFNESNLARQLSKHKCIVVTNKKIDLTLLKQFKENIINLVFFIEKNDDHNFIHEIQSKGIAYVLMSYLSEEELNKKKINYLENGIISRIEVMKKDDIDELKDLDINSLYYQSNGPILSNFKVFKSIFDYENRNVSEDPSLPTVIKENEDFWKELQNFHILKKIDTN